ncbi:MAG: helix-turn-helix transcriptional regulator [Deltaproteobacteria bacterium]|nr:helix-turn-helix transcriptional regulator [Deltaproteobacteria bacterium]MBW1976722.1 helix-turn-helix transcriptional regulator [Deltaproteobacteria bacterium]MBW2299157.1 helix-turn-helix transcriptional regulator [Deltaproteobacteria bacterium]
MEKEIQKRIKMYRKDRGLTLRELAERAGCTHSYISQVEKGKSVPSLSMVGKLASALEVSVVDLLNGLPGVEDKGEWYLSKNDRKTINYPDGKVSSQLLVPRITTRKMEPLISTIKPGGSSDAAEGMNHPPGTEEFVFLIKGELDFAVNGKEIHLKEGDTLSFDGNLPHSWVNSSGKTAVVLFVFTPPIW